MSEPLSDLKERDSMLDEIDTFVEQVLLFVDRPDDAMRRDLVWVFGNGVKLAGEGVLVFLNPTRLLIRVGPLMDAACYSRCNKVSDCCKDRLPALEACLEW